MYPHEAVRYKSRPTVGARIVEGLEQAIAWTRGENDKVRITLVRVPEVDVREVRTKVGLGQAQFRPVSASRQLQCGIGNKGVRARTLPRASCWR
jgi:hypothetical protein